PPPVGLSRPRTWREIRHPSQPQGHVPLGRGCWAPPCMWLPRPVVCPLLRALAPHRSPGYNTTPVPRTSAEVSWPFPSLGSRERLAQPQMLFQVQGLRPRRSLQPQLRQQAIDLALVAPPARPAAQGAAQVLAAVNVQVAQETAEAVDVAHV